MPLDCTQLTPDEREALFGREFREIQVLSFGVTAASVLLTCAVIGGQPLHLVGDPRAALLVLLSADRPQEVRH